MHTTMKISPLITLAMTFACADSEPQPDVAMCDEAQARSVAVQFGERLRMVSVLAADSAADRELRQAYEPLVTAPLLEQWLEDPARAPGRQVSSPWPARLEIQSIAPVAEGCRVEGDIILVTSADTITAVAREPVTLLLINEEGWRISELTATGSTGDAGRAQPDAADSAANDRLDPPADSTDAEAAVDVVRRYYALIQAGDLAGAYAMWRGDGAASGQTFDAFAEGYAQTARVTATAGSPGRIGAAAGSRYIEIPVSVRAVTPDGTAQRFEGTYTLSRSVVDGATPIQRRWRISSADMRRVND